MSRSSRQKDKYGKSSEISQDYSHEGTAARTRPFSFDEIMSKRKSKKLFENEQGTVEYTTRCDIGQRVSDDHVLERGRGEKKEPYPDVLKHMSVEHAKSSSRKKEENTSIKYESLAKGKYRETQDLGIKSRTKINKDMRNEENDKSDEKVHSRRKNIELPSYGTESEPAKKHSRDFVEKKRHPDRSSGQFDRERKRSYRNGVDEKNLDISSLKRYDQGTGHNLETSERKGRKELSKSHYEEKPGPKRIRSRSREQEDKYRRSISLSPRAHKRASYHGRDHGEMSSYSIKGRSGRQHSDVDRSKMMNNGSSSHYRRHDGSTSRLGGYSPRKRRAEATIRTPSPTKRSPEKKIAKWDLAPERRDINFSAPILSNVQSSNQTTSSAMLEVFSAVPVASTTIKPLYGVSLGALSTNKYNTVDSVQLTQATRPMRRLYVENLPDSVSEKDVMECLNKFLISSGLNHIRGTQPCISCILHKEKSQALVEFLTPEDASAALSFDGSPFSGSIIKFRRPRDFVDVATGEREKSVVAVDAISDNVKDAPHKIFIGGISKTFSSKMFLEIASAFGPLKAYRFENSENLNELCAFLEYADQSVTLKACAGLNGMKLGGQVITAVQAVPNASSLENSGKPTFCGIPEHAKPLLEKPMHVLKLKNVFDPAVISSLSHTEIEEVLEDVRLECSRFGTVKSVNVVKHDASLGSSSEACEVNEDMVSAKTRTSLLCDETHPQSESLDRVIGDKTVEQNSADVEKPASDLMEDETCQSNQFNSEIAVEDICISVSQEFSQQHHISRDEPDCSDDGVAENAQELRDTSAENKLMVGEDLKLEEVSGALEITTADDSVRIESDAIEKVNSEEQDGNLGNIFEPGSVFVEFGRIEASSMAAHCLHGRLFDGHTVAVQYVPLDIYRIRFPQ